MGSRYEGKPFLRLLECYILKAIDSLPDADRSSLEAMEPQLRLAFKRLGSWDAIVQAEMNFPVDYENTIRQTWARNVEQASSQGYQLGPEEFARFYADRLSST